MGWKVNSRVLRDLKIGSCYGCFKCWVQTPGICVIDDVERDIAKETIQSDLLIFLTPVTFGGYSSELKKAVDRLIPLVMPFFIKIDGEVHHKSRYERYPSLMGIGVLPNEDKESEQSFKTLVNRNAINFHSPIHTAGVIISNQDKKLIREEIKTLLSEVGAKK
jgi:multimeric flavodoxin WrbA